MIQRKSAEFNGVAVDVAWEAKRQGAALLILVSMDTPPTSGGAVEAIYDSVQGENFDTIVESDDPSAEPAVADVTFLAANPLPLLRGDAIRVTYPNPDNRRVNVTILATDDYLIGGS